MPREVERLTGLAPEATRNTEGIVCQRNGTPQAGAVVWCDQQFMGPARLRGQLILLLRHDLKPARTRQLASY